VANLCATISDLYVKENLDFITGNCNHYRYEPICCEWAQA